MKLIETIHGVLETGENASKHAIQGMCKEIIVLRKFVANQTSISNCTATGATREQMSEARLPLAYRDSCGGLLIPLNRCRVDTCYLPWKCVV